MKKLKFEQMCKRACKLAKTLKSRKDVLIVTHVDADGITSGAIACQSLINAGIECKVVFIKQLDEGAIEKVADTGKFVWFTDLGSGQIDLIEKHGVECIITDHHVPLRRVGYQLNPHDFGVDGSCEFGGATSTYLVARYMNRANRNLSSLAVVGCVGDLQDFRSGKLLSYNRLILKDGVKEGVLEITRDIRLFGKQTRPVYKMLEFTFDPFLPGLSGSEEGSIKFMTSLSVPPKEGELWRRWIDLKRNEKIRITSALVKLLMKYCYPLSSIERLVGEVYILKEQPEGTELKDAMEFSTLLNATARYGYEDVGLDVCLGVCKSISSSRFEKALKRARVLLQNHRRNLSEGIKLVDEIGITELENIQYFHAGNAIMDTIVGIVAGMYFSKANLEKPIIAFANTDDGVKVSGRATQRLVELGVDLSEVMRIAAEKVGGKGGGHCIAAGATIPKGSEEKFLKEVDRIVGLQIRS
ncbi:MAG: recombinase RecJ [Archaeoglobus sp.]|jgi:RecJ-like exonuclease|nr:MAG: recombinase RecJ [Archaeoglobus sp.]